MGSARDLGTRARRLHAVRRGRRRVRRPAGRRCSPTATRRSWPRTSTTRRRSRTADSAHELAAQTEAGAGASGVLRLGDHRRGRRRADRRDRRAAARGRGRRRRPGLGHRLQGRTRSGRREDRLRPDVLGHGPHARPGAARRRRAEGHRDQRLRPRLGRPPLRRSPPGRSESCGASATSGSATRSASRASRRRRATTSPRRRSRRSSCLVSPADKGALHVALAQLAEQDPLINLRQDDAAAGDLRLALRRGAEGGHPGNAGGRLRHRGRLPRDDDDLHRAAGRHRCGRRDHAARRRIRSSPRSGCASSRPPIDAGVEFRLEVELGSMPLAFFKAVEDTVRRDAAAGPLRLAGHRLHGDDDALRLLRRGRATLIRDFDKSMSSTGG